jgi:hypothetical protein
MSKISRAAARNKRGTARVTQHKKKRRGLSPRAARSNQSDWLVAIIDIDVEAEEIEQGLEQPQDEVGNARKKLTNRFKHIIHRSSSILL